MLSALGLLLATAAVYWNSLDAPFVFDDGPAILRNPTIRQLWPLTGPLNPPDSAGGAIGRPVVNLSFALNYAGGRFEVRGYRLANVALHGLAALALWGVLRRMPLVPADPSGAANAMRTRPRPSAESVALCTSLLWAVHPLLSESVVCVVQRTEILGGLFYLLTLLGFMRAVSSDTPARRRRWQCAAVAACCFGVAAKEIVATAPLLALLYDRTFVAGSFRAAWRQRRGFYLSLAGSWLLLGWLMLGGSQRGGTVGFGLGASAWAYLLTQTEALVTYLKLSVWPYPLIVDYGMALARGLRDVAWQATLVVTLLAATLWALWRRPRLGFVGAAFFILLAPSSSFVPLASQTIAEHRMYLPLAAVLTPIVIWLHRLGGTPGRIAFTAAALAAAWLTMQRTDVYRDERRLWSELIALRPDNPRAHVNLGQVYAREEDWASALRHHAEAVRLLPAYADAHNGLGQAMARLGRASEALAEFELAHSLSPRDPLINFNYGTALAQSGRLIEGIERLEASLRANPAQPDVHNNLGLALLLQGRTPEAMTRFRDGLRWDSTHVELRVNLAHQIFAAGDFAEAAEEYRQALARQPALLGARHGLALALVRQGRPAEAVPHYREALALARDSAELHHQLSVALAASGREVEALAASEQAIRLDPNHAAAREHLRNLQGR